MAPEIKEGKVYDGKQADLFSIGVILFIMLIGRFPFREALKQDRFYSLLMSGQIEKYFQMVRGNNLSESCKDVIVRLLSYNGSERYTI